MNTGVGCHFLLPGIFLIQGLKPCLLFGKEILYHWATWEAHEQRLGIAITVISVAGIPWKHCHLPKDSLIRLHNPDVIKCCLGNYLLFKLYFYLKKFFFNFNWRVITLQYCGGFCHTFISVMGVHVFPILTFPGFVCFYYFLSLTNYHCSLQECTRHKHISPRLGLRGLMSILDPANN